MAAYSVQSAKHATLAAGVVDTVTLASFGQVIEVVNRSVADDLSFTFGAVAADVPNPTALGDNVYLVPAGRSLVVSWPVASSGASAVVKLISAAAAPFSVQAIVVRAT